MPVPEDQSILWLALLQGGPNGSDIWTVCEKKSLSSKKVGKSVYDGGKCGFWTVTMIRNVAQSHVTVSGKHQGVVGNGIEKPFAKDHAWCDPPRVEGYQLFFHMFWGHRVQVSLQ